jgi:hypothetical protein
MFCKGECFKGKKQCGLLYEVLLENNKTNQPEVVQKCVFHHLLDSQLRYETGQIRLQASVESERNAKSRGDQKIVAAISNGFDGLMQVANESRLKKDPSINTIVVEQIKE